MNSTEKKLWSRDCRRWRTRPRRKLSSIHIYALVFSLPSKVKSLSLVAQSMAKCLSVHSVFVCMTAEKFIESFALVPWRWDERHLSATQKNINFKKKTTTTGSLSSFMGANMQKISFIHPQLPTLSTLVRVAVNPEPIHGRNKPGYDPTPSQYCF